jgi:hypothetical protein
MHMQRSVMSDSCDTGYIPSEAVDMRKATDGGHVNKNRLPKDEPWRAVDRRKVTAVSRLHAAANMRRVKHS